MIAEISKTLSGEYPKSNPILCVEAPTGIGKTMAYLISCLPIAKANKKKLIIDLQHVEWMNSSGLGILIGAITTLKNNGGKLALAHVSERIQNLLRITKLTDVFPHYPDTESALSALK